MNGRIVMNATLQKISCLIFTPYFGLLVLSIIIQTIGAIGAKYAVVNPNDFNFLPISGNLILAMFLLGTMGFQAVVWQKALTYYPLSFAYPFRSLVNFTVLISAFFLFNESITILNITGLVVITNGIYMLVREDVV
jgi:multidrug transporter EmrE-like cation transporter